MRFGQLSLRARAYIVGVYALAVAIVAVELWDSTGGDLAAAEGWPWTLFAMVTVAATLAHSFPVSTPTKQAFHVSLPFFIVAIILLPAPQVAALLVIVHAAETLRRRRSWFAQVFNVASYVVTAAAAHAIYLAIWPEHLDGVDLGEPRALVGGLAAIAGFMLVNRLLISLAIWFGNGIPPQQQQMFETDSLLTDAILLGLGLPLAYLARAVPWAMALGSAPLLLIHRALDLPNLRAQRRQDALTQLYTVPSFTDACTRELSRARRFGHPVAVLVVDVDRLTKINAEYGYQAGDAIIQGTARVIARTVREYDIAARVVGGEFMILLPEADAVEAKQVAERLHSAIGGRGVEVETSVEPLRIAASIGVAVAQPDSTPEQLVALAEAALTKAKRDGGNRIDFAPTVAGTEPAVPISPAPVVAAAGTQPPPGPEPLPPVPPVAQPSTRSAVDRLSFWSAHPERTAMVVALVVAAVAAIPIVLVAPAVPGLEPLAVLWLIAFVLVADAGSLELSDRSSYSISVVPIIAAGVLLGVPGAVVVGPVSALARGVRRRSRWYKVLFNASTYAIASAAAAAAYDLLDFELPLTPPNLPVLLLAAVIAGLTFYLHTLIVAAGMATELRAGPLRVWSESLRWLWPQYIVLGVMGLLLALAYHAFGIIGAAAFVVPPIMMRYVAKQYIGRTLEHVRQLRALNEQLASEIAQRAVAEEENARLASEAARVAALEELSRLKSEFISIASHELRTPMSSILGFSELLLDQTSAAASHHRMVSIIYEESTRLSHLVDNLLDISRIETGRMTVKPEAVDLTAAVHSVLQPFVASSPRHVLIVEAEPAARWVQVDPNRLNQILTNLISNAVKYSPDGGRVEVSSRCDPTSGSVRFSVSDQGIGIPPEHRERIFERFQRVDSSATRSIRGSGLGLYIVRHLVELHGGSLQVESEVGRGSTFHVTLPVAVPPTPGDPERGGELASVVTLVS